MRLGATLLDVLLILVITWPPLMAIYGGEYFVSGSMAPAGVWDVLISYVMPAVATLLFWKHAQATPGKMVWSARIVDADTGAAPSFNQLLIRYFAYFLSAIPFCLGFVWIAFDRKKQGWHDKIANTVVVR